MKRELAQAIQDVSLECRVPGWDGYGAAAVTTEIVERAIAFAEAIPSGLPMPEVAAEPDGQITFECHLARRQTLSVSVDEDGMLHYAALLGKETICGSEAFRGNMPRGLVDLIGHVNAGSERHH